MRATITGLFLGAQRDERRNEVIGEIQVLDEPDGALDVIRFRTDATEAGAGLLEIKARSSLMTAEVDVAPHRDTDGSISLSCRLHAYAACELP